MTSSNKYVNQWVESVAALTKPKNIVWINGSDEEFNKICKDLNADGTFIKLNEEKFPGCYLSRSHPFDVARVENRTFICSRLESDSGPTNNWADPKEMYNKLNQLFDSSMKGRTMYVVPYLMGPDGSPYSKVGFELTDSAYVVANMRIMARIGAVALKNLKDAPDSFVKGVHSVGTLDPEERYICHFPEDNTIMSINSNYGGNALQGKKCFALRIASTLARKQGWLAEHMLIVGITSPKNETKYFAAAFPSGCGKTNLAMLIPPALYREQGWKVSTVGDDIAWLNVGPDGRLYAINPEAGFFGIAPGTSSKTNPIALETIKKNTIFTNTALNPADGTPWWEGLSDAPDSLIDWTGAPWHPGSPQKAAHANARFTAPAGQCPSIDPKWESPEGVPISGIIFGGRRARVAPLVMEAFDWNHGVFMGATMASERTAAAEGKVGQLRHDPMAMAPFIGYNVNDYLAHWLSFNENRALKLPKIFHVNWFRTDKNGKFIWPGYGENMRVLEWMFARCSDSAEAEKTAIGFIPPIKALRRDELNVSETALTEILSVDKGQWSEECAAQEEYFRSLGPKFPQKLMKELQAQRERLQ